MYKSSFSFLLRFLAFLLLASQVLLPAKAELPSLSRFFSGSSSTGFLPVEQAFVFNFSQQNDEVVIEWEIADGYYLYQDKLTVQTTEASIGAWQLPAGEPYEDEFFGKVNIYKKDLSLKVPLLSATDNASLSIHYQGCAEAGFCYPPERIDIPLYFVNGDQQNTKLPTHPLENSLSQNTTVTRLADNWWQPVLFLFLGIGLAFTPCVLPMYPILTGIVLGGGKKTQTKTFQLSMLYVQGMALTYTLLGLVVASVGLQFQAAFQHPYLLIALSTFFILLAAAMFGAFSLQLPSVVQTKLAKLSNAQQGGNHAGVFAMGAISGLICSPCTTAPLSGALLYVAQSGDLLTGAITLYALALGMGIPLILAALFGNKLLPQAGAWMEKIKALFGFVLLCAPLFFVARLLPEQVTTGLWVLWLLSLSAWLYHCSRTMIPSKIASLFAVIAIIGLSFSAFHGYQLIVQPQPIEHKQNLPFIQVQNLTELKQQLAQAEAQGKAVLLDFYADWCVACKEYEKYTFSDSRVKNELSKFVLIQADVTQNTEQNKALLQEMQVLGLPTLDFWNAKGEAVNKARLSGFVNAKDFMQHLTTHNLINFQ